VELVAGGIVVVGGLVAVFEFDDLQHPGGTRPCRSRMIVGNEILDGEVRFSDAYEDGARRCGNGRSLREVGPPRLPPFS